MTMWRKSSYSDSSGNECVEVAALDGRKVGIRDSKTPHAGHLALSHDGLLSLLEHVKAGRHDL